MKITVKKCPHLTMEQAEDSAQRAVGWHQANRQLISGEIVEFRDYQMKRDVVIQKEDGTFNATVFCGDEDD